MYRKILAAMLCMLTLLLASGSADAQNCSLTVHNTTTCTVNICVNGTCIDFAPGLNTIPINPCGMPNIFTVEICRVPQQIDPGDCYNKVSVSSPNFRALCCADVCMNEINPGVFLLTIVPVSSPCVAC